MINATNRIIANDSFVDHSVFTKAEDITLKFLYVFVSLAAIVGNSAVCYIIIKYKKIQNTVNLLLLNLAFADIITALGVYPYLFLDLSKTNIRGKSANLLCGLSQGLILFFSASFVNLLTLSVLSLSRYTLINHPTKRKWRIRKSSVKWLSIATWLISFSMLIPNGVSFRYNPDDNICWRHWSTGIVPVLYFISTVIVGMVIPLFTLTFTYVSTIYTLWFKPSTRRLSRSNSQTTVGSSRKRISVLLGLLILAFLICWLPFGIYWFLSVALNYFPKTVEGQIRMTRIVRYTVLVALLNTSLDPIVYAYSNRQIKDGARRIVRRATINMVEPSATD